MGSPAWHADEHYLVYVPLKFFSGDLNPGQDLVAFYPGLHYYVLAVLYDLLLLIRQIATGASFLEVLAQHYFWEPDAILLVARLVGVAFAVGMVWWVGRLAARVGGGEGAVTQTTADQARVEASCCSRWSPGCFPACW